MHSAVHGLEENEHKREWKKEKKNNFQDQVVCSFLTSENETGFEMKIKVDGLKKERKEKEEKKNMILMFIIIASVAFDCITRFYSV